MLRKHRRIRNKVTLAMVELAFHTPAATRLIAEISAERLRELQRFAELGRVSAGLIHDISSPLTAAILHLEREEGREVASIKHARRSIRVLERYIESARQQLRQESKTTSFCIRSQFCQVKRVVKPIANHRGVRLYFAGGKNYKIVGDPVKFQQIMANLIMNSIDAYPDNATRASAPVVRVSTDACCEWLNIRVRDWGTGISADQIPHLFEPFYSTKRENSTSGLGIGLSTVKRYVEKDFAGSIEVVSTKGSGAEFNVKLRRVSPNTEIC